MKKEIEEDWKELLTAECFNNITKTLYNLLYQT